MATAAGKGGYSCFPDQKVRPPTVAIFGHDPLQNWVKEGDDKGRIPIYNSSIIKR